MKETAADIFAKIALEKKFLSEEQLAKAREAHREAKKEKRSLSVEAACVELGFLSPEQSRGIARGIRYYVARKVDKIYGKVAIEKGIADADTVRNCLSKQHDEFFKNKKLVRVSKLLMGLDAVTEAEDADVRAVVISKLTPEESAHEAEAVKEDEAPALPLDPPASEDEEAIAEEVAASADEDDAPLLDDEPVPAGKRDLDFSDDDLALAGDAKPPAAPGKPRAGLVRKPGGAKIPEKPIGLAKQAKSSGLGARLRARSDSGSEKKGLPAKPGDGGLLRRKKG
jgi:hypothetical protein